ncbi:tyrosine-type recombinase/integrase [Spartinivicinus ruber]|uniref:tyrosine-type recombinase/integrase n=1 Tax=Spartinivicinus ruber TaxID=2683272 RepID=UPI0013D0B0C0|nr:site-specific integrase [Spartinivicinus ruber]
MLTIVKRPRANGNVAYRAVVRVKWKGKIVYSESRTFDRERLAKAWGKKRELELQTTDGIEKLKVAKVTVAELIERYIQEVDPIKRLGRSKRYTLEQLRCSDLGRKSAVELTSSDVIDHCKIRQSEGAGPATVSQDVTYLRTIFSLCQAAWGMPITSGAIDAARPVLNQLGLIGKSSRRDRRVTPDEINQLSAAFKERFSNRQANIPMSDIFEFAIETAMRQNEICSLRWEDLNLDKKTIVIRERKDPKNKHNNHQEVPLLGKALGIVLKQPQVSDLIFPYNSKSVGAAFTRVVRSLGIHDLRFHDLRHEAASRLFEQGYDIQEVALVTGHKDWNMLRRYTQIKPESLHR